MATASKTQDVKPRRITIELLEQRDLINEKRLELGRQIRALEKLQDAIDDDIATFVSENGGRRKEIAKGKYTLRLVDQRCRVSWKAAFVSHNGEDAAMSLIESAPCKKVLVITKGKRS